ncbi:MAG: macro domain-containing protein, partial [Spirochaetaceae bacterium]|nr:macro domain-containing protein [Spirochaetaceae bacterium]
TVGPVWHGGMEDEESLLASAYRNALERAAEVGAHTLAYPAISTGVYGYPGEKAAKVVWKVLSARLKHHTLPEKIYLIFFSDLALSVFMDNVPPPDTF